MQDETTMKYNFTPSSLKDFLESCAIYYNVPLRRLIGTEDEKEYFEGVARRIDKLSLLENRKRALNSRDET